MINESMIGQIVCIRGRVEQAHFPFLVADRSGQISAKMFTELTDDVNKGGVVEVQGMVKRHYRVIGDSLSITL